VTADRAAEVTGSAPVARSSEAIEARCHTTVIALMEPGRLRTGPAAPPDELSLKIWKGETDVTDVLSHNHVVVTTMWSGPNAT